MDNYIEIFNRLWEHSESEVVEFKKAEYNFDIDELGRYFSALSNEANLRERESAWSQHTTDNLIFREIVPVEIEDKRVLLFKVPASPRNIVMCWKGIAYGRDGESLKPLNQAKRDAIRQQPPMPDWTAQLVPNATIDDLDELAYSWYD